MKRILAVLVVLTGLLLTSVAQAAPVEFTDSYKRYESWAWFSADKCQTVAPLTGFEPSEPGTYPVLVYNVGTFGSYNGIEAKTILSRASARGFVAISVKYDDFWAFSPSGVNENAKCIYRNSISSAVGKACARPKADCTKGIVASGHSQGGAIAARSKNHNSQVRAGYLLGVNGPLVHTDPAVTALLRSMALPPPAGTRALTNNQIRVVNGRTDVDSAPAGTMNELTGSSCPATQNNCLRDDGSGYYTVKDSEVADGQADHCYFQGGGGCSVTPPFDPNWLNSTTLPWTLEPSLVWAKSRTG